MKELYVLILFICLAGFGTNFAQTLKGHIYDANTNELLAGAVATYKLHGNQGTVSDINRAYEIKLPERGTDLVFSYIGYEDVLIPIAIGKREMITKDVYAKENTKLLEGIVISAERFKQRLSSVTASMDLVKAGNTVHQALTDITSILRTLPDVDIVDKQPSMRDGGEQACGVGTRSQTLIGGISTLSSKIGEINWDTIPLKDIEQVKIIERASSVLYGSSTLNGIINIRTVRPGLVPKTRFSAYIGIYGDAEDDEYQWSDKSFWEDDKYSVEPILCGNLLSGIRNPIYGGFDLSHSRRINNFDVGRSTNLFTDEGYRQQGYNKRFRMGGSLTYHQPDMGIRILNYGLNVDFLSNQYGDFFTWGSPTEVCKPSPFANMGREENNFHTDPFIDYVNPGNGASHKIEGRFYHSTNNIVKPSRRNSTTDILGNMGANTQTMRNITGGDYSSLYPALVDIGSDLIDSNLEGAMNGIFTSLSSIFPSAAIADYCDPISWVMDNELPGDLVSGIQSGQVPSDLIPWLSNVMNPARNNAKTKADENYNYCLDYQFNKKWDGSAQITTGMTYEYVRYNLSIMGQVYRSDSVAALFQCDQCFWDRLSVSAGVRAKYYRVNNHHCEAETKIFGVRVPFHPVFRTGLDYQLTDYSFICANVGQGYRNPSINEKYLCKDIGGVGIYPDPDIKSEKGYNVEPGFEQGYKVGNFQGFVDVAGSYIEYRDMTELQFGLSNNVDCSMINSISDATQMVTDSKGFGIGAQFHNVSRAQIYGVEISTDGVYDFNKNTKLFYNLGCVHAEPRDADYKGRNEIGDLYTDAFQMKEKSNTGEYLKYHPKHSFKATVDF